MKRSSAKTKRAAEAERRRDGRHCPVCLAVLPRLAGARGAARRCARCGAEPVPGRRCAHCDQEAVWVAATNAACSSCGRHGSTVTMIAGHDWLAENDE
jgi:hypothetical protein